MDIALMFQTAGAVVLANAATVAFCYAAVIAWRKQTKEGKSDTELPLWVYPCLIGAPLLVAIGFYLSPVP